MSSHFFGPLGSMKPLTVSAGASVETSRAFSEFISSGGVRHIQRGRSAPRTWSAGRAYQGPDWARILGLAAHGVLPECWLYDVAEARENMIPSPLCVGKNSDSLVRWTRKNYMVNPRFVGTTPTSASPGWSTRAQRTYSSPRAGVQRVSFDTAPSTGGTTVTNTLPQATFSGGRWTHSMLVKNVGPQSETITLRHYPAGSFSSDSTSDPVVLAPGDATRISVTSKTVGPSEAQWQVYLYCHTYIAGTAFELSQPLSEFGPTAPPLGSYFDGSFPNASWEGSANASASILSGQAVLPAERVSVDGLPLVALREGHSVKVPVLGGHLYTVSVWADASPGSSVASFQLGTESAKTVFSAPGQGHRSCAASFTPREDAIATITVTTAGASGLRLHEGAPDGKYFAGHGTPCKVAVKDPERTLQLVSREVRGDYQVTLVEVGQPGQV